MLGKIKQRIYDSIASAKVRENPGKRRILLFGLRTCIFLRRRDADAYAKIECICDEEIKEAVRFVFIPVLNPMEDLIIQTLRVLGIKTTRKNTWGKSKNLFNRG
ncbi:hypothetical protein [Methanosarcina sp.]|uniref:hypothetical protein n=1 Tax=Methanosarcina sp. TaxID=2213 RepID=UPI002ABC1AFD|nr:hypothetical protein [Methanosarcina sp.]MDY9926743.1 hypothetical protein [Methanosarcina sp.]